MIEGFDVSKWQSPEKWNWEALKRRGIKFIVARASYGKGTADPTFVRYAELARQHEIAFGAYHFYRQIHSVEQQLAVFDKQLELIGGLKPFELFPVLDMEENSANGDGRPKPEIFSGACYRIANTLRERYGGVILYYSSYFPEYLRVNKTPDYWTANFKDQSNFRHWLADYNRDPGKPRTPYTDKWHLHQPKPRAVPEYANGSTVVDYDAMNPNVTIEQILIKQECEDVSVDAKMGEDDTTGRPGGARGVKPILERLAKLA